MRLPARILPFVLALLATSPLGAAENAVKTVRIFFVGNSLTYSNQMPSLFEEFAEAAYPNLDVVTTTVVSPGATFKSHWEKGGALHMLRQTGADYVILQEQGALPLGLFRVDGVRRHGRPEEFFDYGERLAKAVVSAGAKPVFYQTYTSKTAEDDLFYLDQGSINIGRKKTGPMPPASDLHYLDYAYMTLGKKMGAPVAPVGRVWSRVRGAQKFDLYEDDLHPSIHGSYLVAATLASTLFGDPPSPEAVRYPASIPEGDARAILAAVRSVREELAPTGGYAEVPVPEFSELPSLRFSLPIEAGTWTLKSSGLELSLGSRLTVSLDSETPKIEWIDFTLNGAFPLPIRDLSLTGNVFQFHTASQNRGYKIQLARDSEGVVMLVEQNKNQSKVFTHARYRPGPDDYFDFLDKQFEHISRQATQESFDAALLGHYEALSSRLGAAELARILMGQLPLSNEWFAILTGWEYSSRQQHDAAVRILTFATNRFPKSVEAFRNLSEALEKAGRIEDAYNAVLRAESLLTQTDPSALAERVQQSKARLEKLRS